MALGNYTLYTGGNFVPSTCMNPLWPECILQSIWDPVYPSPVLGWHSGRTLEQADLSFGGCSHLCGQKPGLAGLGCRLETAFSSVAGSLDQVFLNSKELPGSTISICHSEVTACTSLLWALIYLEL